MSRQKKVFLQPYITQRFIGSTIAFGKSVLSRITSSWRKNKSSKYNQPANKEITQCNCWNYAHIQKRIFKPFAWSFVVPISCGDKVLSGVLPHSFGSLSHCSFASRLVLSLPTNTRVISSSDISNLFVIDWCGSVRVH